MMRVRNISLSDRPSILSSRSADVIRATTVRFALLAAVFGCAASAVAGGSDKPAAPTLLPHSPRLSPGGRLKQWFETGQASWYGLKFQGRKTANGEHFDMNTFTCAHRSMPLGSWLRVTNLRNRKSVLVRVNDRGPMVDDRIVDLSYAAARAVGLGGTGKVKLERVNIADPEVVRTMFAELSMPALPQLLPAR